MQDTLGESLKKLKWLRIRKTRMSTLLLVLSLIVSLDVFYVMRQPGLTLAGDASCGILEHSHDDECCRFNLICGLSDEVHCHDESCYETVFVEAQDTKYLICDLVEEPHEHDAGCYETVTVEPVTMANLICTIEDEGHGHDNYCYENYEVPGYEEQILSCSHVPVPHEHGEGCYYTEHIEAHEEQQLICGLSEEVHSHSEDCYELEITCKLKEHVHCVDCYSDESADVETLLDWQNMFASYPYTGNLRDDLVAIAKTQVGYSESVRNFQIGGDGLRRGYTRYGGWYGAPYSDWSAMFVSFCLNYAGADMDMTPGNIGVTAMAEQWWNLGRYMQAGEYTPLPGDLAFFADGSVGIVTEVYNGSFNVIRGDVNDAVCSENYPIADGTVIGWGITVKEQPEEEAPPKAEDETPAEPEEEEKLPEKEVTAPEESSSPVYIDLLDISNGPALYIFVGGSTEPQVQGYRLRSAMPAVTAQDLLAYLEAYGGDYFFTLLDHDNHELEKDDNGHYIVYPDTGYKMTITFNSPRGFHPGVYEYQTPDGLKVDGGEGSFVLTDGTNVGSWTVSDEGLITLVFNDNINSRTDITISAALGIYFPMQDEPIDFDGKISVTIEEPPQNIQTTFLNKWGNAGVEGDSTKPDPSKIYWKIYIEGKANSNIPGSILRDRPVSGAYLGDHSYTQSDMDAGINIGVGDPNGGWHSWKVYPGDPNLTWTEEGWSYKIPETATCIWCGNVQLGNEGWTYYVEYSSTPDTSVNAGTYYYMNRATVDNQYIDGGASFSHGDALGEVFKTGSFVTDAGGGAFQWEFQAVIPGMAPGQKGEYAWYIMDYLNILNPQDTIDGHVHNDAHLSTITTDYYGTTITVPRVQDATDADPFAWHNAWSAPDENGTLYGREIDLLCRCNCNEENCQFWAGWCPTQYWYERDDGTWEVKNFCQCWTAPDTATFTFTYRTEDLSMVENLGGLDYELQNVVELYNKPNGTNYGILVSSDYATVPIPGIFGKTLTHDFDGYTAHYRISVNEAKLVLTNGTPLTIHDVMTDSLAYISGSLVITTEDAAGNTATLQQGTDYTVAYDGSGNDYDDYGNSTHVLNITILKPQPVTYTLDYDATLIIPDNISEGIKYKNSASISLWGQDITDDTVEKVYADINIAAKSYKVEMYKLCAQSGEPLGGATFGLFNEHGGLITTDVTDENGQLVFQTDIVNGIVLREHDLLYMQELEAPPGYQIDHKKYWFCFCDLKSDSCPYCDQTLAGKADSFRIPFEQIGKIHVVNEPMDYDLPATGGSGIYPLLLMSVIFIVTPLVYGFISRRKRERRGVG